MRHLVLASLSCVALGCATSAPAPAPAPQAAPVATPAPAADPKPPELRLPTAAWPTRYALDLTVDPAKEGFRGSIQIDLKVSAPTSVLWLNATELQVDKASVRVGSETLTARIIPGGEDFVGFVLPRELAPGTAVLTVDYQGKLDRERSRGLYAVAENGVWYAYTFFEPTDARRAFPCFDEPNAKVPWTLTLHIPNGEIARANSPIASEAVEGELKKVVFAESKPLPSYLVAFMVGPFDVVEAPDAGHHHTALRFIVPKGRGPETRYAASVTPRIISELEDYFGMPYPYEKLDVAVVPRFWGTMEHPGIVALGQPLTLIKPEEESEPRKQRYTNIAVHELAHYWFGDYVTTAWWNDTWLNETLGSWMDEKISDRIEPRWRYSMRHVDLAEGAMRADALPSVKRLREPVKSRSDIESSFDNEITYAKGAAVVKMFEHWIGEEKFQHFIRRYMAEHAWGNATSEDFVHTLGEEAGPEAAQAFTTFLDQPGVARITPRVDCPKGAKPSLHLEQARYVPEGSAPLAPEIWQLPICFRTSAGGVAQCTLLKSAAADVPLHDASCPAWVLLKDEGVGYFHTGYTLPQLQALLAAKGKALSIPERLATLGDLRAGQGHGDLSLADGLALVPALARETDRSLIFGSMQLLGEVREDFISDALRPRWTSWIHGIFGPRAAKLGFVPHKGESDDDQFTRPGLLVTAAQDGEDAKLRKEARKLAQAWLQDRKAVAPSVVNVVLHIAAISGDRALFDAYEAEARKPTTSREDRSRLLANLGAFPDRALVGSALELLKDPSVDIRDSSGILEAALHNRFTRDDAWTFLGANYDALTAKMRGDETSWLLQSLGNVYCDAAHLEELKRTYGPRAEKVDGGARAFAKGLGGMALCVARADRERQSLAGFLQAQRAPAKAKTAANP